MPELTSSYAQPQAGARSSTATVFGQVMSLVAIAIAFLVAGTIIGRDLDPGTAQILGFVGFGMLMVAAFGGRRFRFGTFAMVWLFAVALGIGLGPARSSVSSWPPSRPRSRRPPAGPR